jgi:hypothetical protein
VSRDNVIEFKKIFEKKDAALVVSKLKEFIDANPDSRLLVSVIFPGEDGFMTTVGWSEMSSEQLMLLANYTKWRVENIVFDNEE